MIINARGGRIPTEKEKLCHNTSELHLYNKQLLIIDLFHVKFLNYILKKFGTDVRVPKREIYRLLACLYSLNKRESRVFLNLLVERFDFVKISNFGLIMEVGLI